MFDPKSKDSVDVLAAIENAPEIIHVAGPKAAQCVVKNCDDDPPVTQCVIKNCDDGNAGQRAQASSSVALCDADDSPVALCDIDDNVVAQCDRDDITF